MKKTIAAMMIATCALSVAAARAQDNKMDGPPPVLVVQREFTKPGKGGAVHEKTEGAFIAAMKANKGQIHYFAITALSGPDRALFLSGYPDFATWEAERKTMTPSLGAALDHANVADGDALMQADASVWTLRPDLSLHTGSLQGVRYMEIQQFVVKPGHRAEFNELTKMYLEGFKDMPEANWATFDQMYGMDGTAVIAISTLKSLAEADKELVDGQTFGKSLSKEQQKKMRELEAASVESVRENLFAINPKMSLPPEEWIKADPDFWKPKAAPVKKAEAKPAQ